MNTTTLTQLGNSNAIIVPAPVLKESKWARGKKFTIEYNKEADTIFIRPIQKASNKKKSETEFKAWLEDFLKEDAELLDKLA